MMNDYEWCKYAYDRGWARKDQLIIWVRAKKITEEEFKGITDMDYREYVRQYIAEQKAKRAKRL